MATDFLLLTAILGLIIYYIFHSNRRPKNFPPGPSRIPFFGNAFQLGIESFKVAMNLREKYGDIIGFQMGSVWSVYLHDVDDIRDAFNRPEMQGKNMYNTFLDQAHGQSNNHGIIHSEGRPWQDNRRFALRTLRDFGFGKKTMESIIMEETTQLIKELKKTVDTPISTSHAFNASVLNVIWSIVAGERYDYHDSRLEELMSLLIKFFATMFDGIKGFYIIFPALLTLREKVPFLFPKPNNQFRDNLFDFLRTTIQKHRETFEEGAPRDLIDTYLEEQRKTEDPTSTFYSKVDDKDLPLVVMLMDLFVAGAETTSTTLCWSFLLLALNPEAQEKLCKEIKTVVGTREISLSDRASLPYVQATIMEIMRVSSIAAIGAHTTSQDVEFKGFTFPKNTVVVPNLWALHQRRDIWGDPENFRPERFLSADGKTVDRNNNLIPFLVGKHACPGEPLAKDEIFLFLTNLCQQFKIELPEGVAPYPVKHCFGAVMTPQPHQIVLRDRTV